MGLGWVAEIVVRLFWGKVSLCVIQNLLLHYVDFKMLLILSCHF